MSERRSSASSAPLQLKDGKPLELYEEARRSGDWKQISSIKLIYKQLTGYKTA